MKTLPFALAVLVGIAIQPSTLFAQGSESQARATERAKRLSGEEPASFAAVAPSDPEPVRGCARYSSSTLAFCKSCSPLTRRRPPRGSKCPACW